MKNQLLVTILLLLTFGRSISFAQDLPKQILAAPEDSLAYYIEKSKQIIQSQVIDISAEEIASCGLSCYQRGELHCAKEYFILAKDEYLDSQDSLSAGKMLSNIAVIYELEGNYDKATEVHYEALNIFTQSGDQNAIARAMNNLGVLYQEINDSENAMSYYRQALNIKQALKDSSGIASSLNNLGVLWEENLNNTDSALYYYEQSHSIYKSINDIGNQAKLLSNISAIYVDKKDFSHAIELLEEGKELAILSNDKINLNNILKNSAYAYLSSGQITQAKSMIEDGLRMSIELEYLKNQVEFLDLKAKIEEQNGEFKACVSTLKHLQVMKDSLLNKEKNEAISKQKVMFDTNRKEHQIEMAEQALMFSEFELKRQKDIFLLAIISFIFIGLTVLLLVYRARLKAKNRQIALENKMLRSQLNPHFLFNALGAIQNYMLEHDSMDSMVYLLDFSKLMRNILDGSRAEEISVKKEGEILNSYLKLQQLRFTDSFRFNISIDPQIDQETTTLPPMLLQPFLENAIEHGMKKIQGKRQGEISLSISTSKNTLILQVSDNGPGFANENKNKDKHISHAMNITKERIEAINHLKKYRIALDISENKSYGVNVKFEILCL